MVIANYSSIHLYAQLAILAENGPKDCRPSFSADAPRPIVRHNRSNLRVNLHWDEKTDHILRFLGSEKNMKSKIWLLLRMICSVDTPL